MAPGTEPPIRIEDPALQGGEWLFRRNGQVFGPVDSRTVAAMLYRGDLDPTTEVSGGEGAWVPVGEVPIFVLHAKKAEAAQRVEREVTGARMLRQRSNRRYTLLVAAAALLLVTAGIGGGLLVWRLGGSPGSSSPLLEDFGAGIRIASAARVGVSSRAAPEDLIEVPLDAPDEAGGAGGGASGSLRRERSGGLSGAAGRSRAGEVDGGDLVAAQFDEGKIQATVARQQRTLVPCFREEAARSPEFKGDVPIEFAVGNDGRVVALWIDEPRLRDGALHRCLQHALAGWRFDTFPGQRPTVSLAFRIGE